MHINHTSTSKLSFRGPPSLPPSPPAFPVPSGDCASLASSSHHGRIRLRIFLPQLEHFALYHVRDVPSEPVVRNHGRIGIPLDAAQVLPRVSRSDTKHAAPALYSK